MAWTELNSLIAKLTHMTTQTGRELIWTHGGQDVIDAIREVVPYLQQLRDTRPSEQVVTEAMQFDRADWFWRTMDPDDSGDTPAQALHRSMLGHSCVCEIASSFNGPTRYGFTAPVLDLESDDEEFLHFPTEQEAIEAAKERSAALKAAMEAKGLGRGLSPLPEAAS